MSYQYWSWILGFVGLIGFWLAGKKIWWCWYINIANQAIWLAYSLITHQYGFLVATFFYTWVFVKNAYSWTKEHFDAKKPSRTNYCMGRWDGENWVAPGCTVPGIPHEPHAIEGEFQDWDFNHVAMPNIKLYDGDIPPEDPTPVATFVHPKQDKILRTPIESDPRPFCTGRPRHPDCQMPVLAHKPHFVSPKEGSS